VGPPAIEAFEVYPVHVAARAGALATRALLGVVSAGLLAAQETPVASTRALQ
jgi:hypothetical protein